MPQITDLNIAPYYDDFDKEDNFHRVLFRPGFSIQARELTQLQSILQNQVERFGRHMFQEGTVVIPGQLSYSNITDTIQLASTFAGETIDLNQYLNTTTPVIITGATSGMTAKVIGVQDATSTTQPILVVQYINSGSDNETFKFADNENISADVSITHTTSYESQVASATTHDELAARRGSAVKIEEGVYYVRGQFVRCAAQELILSTFNVRQSARIGFTVTEELTTPEVDASLTDNATGTSNFAAKGAHRLKINLILSKRDLGSSEDTDFIELMTIRDGVQIVNTTEVTKYSQIGDTLARRTFDESGDYTVRPFQFEVKESIDNSVKTKQFDGQYTNGQLTDDGNIAGEEFLAIACSLGKAYVRGYEIEKTSLTHKDLRKARSFESINAGVSNLEIGNFVRVTNVFGQPDIADISGETTPYKTVQMFDSKTTTRGSASGKNIGVARTRTFEYSQGVAGETGTEHKLFLFDIQMFTRIELNDTPSPTLTSVHTTGARVKGHTSNAIGFLFSTAAKDDTTADAVINLVNVTGTFQVGEKIQVSDSTETGKLVENSDNTDLTIESLDKFKFVDVKQFFMDDDDSGQDFTADIADINFTSAGVLRLNATDSSNSDSGEGLLLEDQSEGFRIELETFAEAKLEQPEKNSLVFRMPKRVIKTLKTTSNAGASDSQITIRRQFVGTTNSSGAVSFSAGANESFVSFANKDYHMSILTAGGGTGAQGDVVSLSGKLSATGGSTLTITDNTILGASAKVKFIGTVTKTSVDPRLKTTNLLKQVKVLATDADGSYGVRSSDKEISLGRADVFRVQAVYDSEDSSTDASVPSITITGVSGSFSRGEKITGSSSRARGRILSTTSPLQYSLNGVVGSTDFVVGETITGESSGATATVGELTAGSKVVTQNFELDTGQRDNLYDISRLVRKPNRASPAGRLLVVFDFFSHSSGEFFSVDSYSANVGQMNYDDIPTFNATRVDPDDPEPTGKFDLRDCLDFRPTVQNVTGASDTVTSIDTITGNSFDFSARLFSGTGGVTVNLPQPNSTSTHDFEFYLAKMASIFLTHKGEFKLVEGASAEDPRPPKPVEKAMKLASIYLPPFTFKPTDVQLRRMKTQRFTMRDIGRLKDRLETVESQTALSLLERSAESFEVTDANGLNRFKSGFIVDNFSGHRVGDTLHKDYNVAIDMQRHQLRPKCVMRNVSLTELNTTDTARTSSGYQKTGDLITLPYTSVSFIDQPYATRVENVQTYLIREWVGKITLNPSTDEWFETETVPAVVINVEGNYNTILNGLKNDNVLGTVWNAWETQWSGIVDTETEKFVSQQGNVQDEISVKTIETVKTDLARTGISTEVVENVEEEVIGKKIIARAVIPFVRPRTISVTGECFRPGVRLYPFFDGKDVSSLVTPTETQYSNVDSPVEGSALVTNGAGKIIFNFRIPEHRFAGQENALKFRTGEIELKLTTDQNDKTSIVPASSGHSTYHAVGILETEQETILATRNAEVVQETVSETKSTTEMNTFTEIIQNVINNNPASGYVHDEENPHAPDEVDYINAIFESHSKILQMHGQGDLASNFSNDNLSRLESLGRSGHDGFSSFACNSFIDPLAQTFIVQENGGCFLTKVDLYFAQKDNTLPVWVEIRNVSNGYPSNKLIPFGRKVLEPADVNVDANTASSSTTFTFDSPVYLQEGFEYCVVVMTNSLDYKLWITQMGEQDVSGTNRLISSQPHLGSLFKSQNNRVWNAIQSQDMKFTMYKAKFTEPTVRSSGDDLVVIPTKGTVTLRNNIISEARTTEEGDSTVYGQRLLSNPIVMTNGDTTIKVRHQDHGMYDADNNVSITGVSSGISTTLNGSLTTDSTSLTLTSATSFPSSGTVTVKISNEILSGTISGTTLSSLTRGIGASDAAAHSDDATVELYMINSVPLTEINKTHTTIGNINIDSYTFECTTTPVVAGVSGDAEVGGTAIYASENYRFELMKSAIETMAVDGTLIKSRVRSTSGTSPSGTENSFTTVSTANSKEFPLDENFRFETSRLVASQINETNEMSGAKSFFIDLDLFTSNENISPVLDLGRASVVLVANRLNNIDSSSDVYPTSDFNASTEPDGDQNAAIYLTKGIALENPATSIKVIFSAIKKGTSDIKVLFKTLGADQSKDFDELGFEFFNTTGTTDSTVRNSLSETDFQEYEFTTGVTDDGIGEPLSEFSQFQIKIVMQGTDAANPPLLKDLRILALAT